MKKETKVLSFILLGLLITSFLTSAVSAKFTQTGFTIPQSVQDAWSGWKLGNLDAGFAKILVFLLVFMIIFLLVENIFGELDEKISVGISLVISFLATAYITPDQVLSLMTSYAALGLTITTLVPLALLGGLTFQATKPDSEIGLVITQWLAWGLFLLYSMYKFGSAWASINLYSVAVMFIVLAAAIVAFIMVVFNRQILRLITKKFIEAESERASRKIAESKQFIEATSASFRDLAGKPKK